MNSVLAYNFLKQVIQSNTCLKHVGFLHMLHFFLAFAADHDVGGDVGRFEIFSKNDFDQSLSLLFSK